MRADAHRDIFDFAWRHLPVYQLLRALCTKHQVRSYLEIGFRLGGSMETVCKAAPALESVVTFDLFSGHFGGVTDPAEAGAKIAKWRPDVEFLVVPGPSVLTVPAELQHRRQPFDLAFIDGGHHFNTITEDLEHVVPHARLTVVHDLGEPEVWEAFSQFVQGTGLPFWTIGDPQGSGLIYRPEADA